MTYVTADNLSDALELAAATMRGRVTDRVADEIHARLDTVQDTGRGQAELITAFDRYVNALGQLPIATDDLRPAAVIDFWVTLLVSAGHLEAHLPEAVDQAVREVFGILVAEFAGMPANTHTACSNFSKLMWTASHRAYHAERRRLQHQPLSRRRSCRSPRRRERRVRRPKVSRAGPDNDSSGTEPEPEDLAPLLHPPGPRR